MSASGPFQTGPQSLFFKCYSDEIYEAILEGLRNDYLAISNQDLDDEDDDDMDNEQVMLLDDASDLMHGRAGMEVDLHD